MNNLNRKRREQKTGVIENAIVVNAVEDNSMIYDQQPTENRKVHHEGEEGTDDDSEAGETGDDGSNLPQFICRHSCN